MLAVLLTVLALAGPRVVLIQSDDLAPYEEPVPGFLDELGEPVRVVNLYGRRAVAEDLTNRLRRERPEVVVALGAKAAWAAHEQLPGVPLVIASVLDPGRYGLDDPAVCGVSARVDPTVHLSQFVGFFPDVTRIGVLVGTDGAAAAAVQQAAVSVGLEPVRVPVSDAHDVRRVFARGGPEVDALWLPADRELITAEAFRTLVAESRRRGVLLVVESENMVRAGGGFAAVPQPEGTGRQAARLTRRILDGEDPSGLGLQAPEVVLVAMNLDTLRRSGHDLDELLLDFVDLVVD